jgi:hypothetical protein
MITGGSLEALGAGAPAQWRDDFCPASALVGAGFEPSVPRDTTKISRPAYVACACSRPTEIRRRERDPRPRGRGAPSAGPMVRVPFPPAASHERTRLPRWDRSPTGCRSLRADGSVTDPQVTARTAAIPNLKDHSTCTTTVNPRSAFPSSIAQTFECVCIVLRPMPGRTPTNVEIERSRRYRDRLCQCLSRLLEPAGLAEGGSKPTVDERMIGISSDHPSRSIDASFVIATEIETQDDLIDADPRARVARIQPDAALQGHEFRRFSVAEP